MTDAPLFTPADMADFFRTTEKQFLEWRRNYEWPCVQVGRTLRFTAAQRAEIVARHSKKHQQTQPAQQAPAKGEAVVVSIPGQTRRSASRSA
jgi:hypothetical protein